jgi:hypothetical protein
VAGFTGCGENRDRAERTLVQELQRLKPIFLAL